MEARKLKSYAQEVIWRNQLSSLLISKGYNVFLPVFDNGIDLIAHRESDGDLKLIQQKGRWSILKKYRDRDIWIAFPHAGSWYLIPHDEMLTWPEVAGFLLTQSWIDKGTYHNARPSKAMVAQFERFYVGPAAVLS